ncbi:MAG: methyltransferase domain-containing protein [Pelosinus sp.]|nr:methyltransferase domain-containing protein [Pelosinus sp.]
MVHKFNVNAKQKLDNPERRKLLPPEETLRKLGLAEGDILADIGCGIGYFTLPAARMVGTSGKVYAIDVIPEMLAEVQGKIKSNDLTNVEVIQGQENDFLLEDKTVKYALVSLVVHEAEDPFAFFREIRRILKISGRVFIIEWTKKQGLMGPPIEHRLDNKAVAEALLECGFNIVQQFDLNSEMYAIIAERKD